MSKRLAVYAKDMKSHKDAFLDKFNPKRTLDKALASGITASVQHNSLYRPNGTHELRDSVKCEWRRFLQALTEPYSTSQSVVTYENDIESLKDLMNTKFYHAFRDEPHPKFKTDPGFRISHAQKSIAVFLKHLWCMGHVATPPQCPVDGIILAAAGARYPATKWGCVNSLAEHQAKIQTLISAKANPSEALAEWELKTFKAYHMRQRRDPSSPETFQ